LTVFKTDRVDHTSQPAFFGEPVNIARYESVKYPAIEKLTEKQLSFFWRPEEIELTRDSKDFKGLTEHEKHIFTSNLKRQILLDSVQGRAPTPAFLPIVSLPELETWIQTWAFSETIHSRSYTHIIRNVYSDPSKIFDEMLEIQEIIDCAKDISKYYDKLIVCNNQYQLFDRKHKQHKEFLWKCLNAVNALEGIRFYVSFACSWAFAEVKKMEGNAKIIKLIARDENIHLAATQQLLKILPNEDPDFAEIKEKTKPEMIALFNSVIDQEKAWAQYLFKDGSMIGLNEKLLCDYVDWIGHKRMTAIGLNGKSIGTNSLPWTQKWISGSELQVAPQETEITSYIIGGINKDVDENTFAGFTL
jgi:ribonucleoside-diphosphate reductase beta chain